MIDDVFDQETDFDAGLLLARAMEEEYQQERRMRRRQLLILLASLAMVGIVWAVMR